MTVPLIEHEGGDSMGSSGSRASTFSATDATGEQPAASRGPSVTVALGDGSSVTLDAETLQFYLAVIQTLLLLYVTYKEVSA